MHDIEPYHRWRDYYIASEDKQSPFYGKESNDFWIDKKIYNYYIHPQWDEFGSSTLYLKVLYADYDEQVAILELIGEWNDCLHNDIMFLKRNLIEPMMEQGISKFILICENVLNFHGSDDCYYEEWSEETRDEKGWICFLNVLKHVDEEMHHTKLHYYVHFGDAYNEVNWRVQQPEILCRAIEALVRGEVRRLY